MRIKKKKAVSYRFGGMNASTLASFFRTVVKFLYLEKTFLWNSYHKLFDYIARQLFGYVRMVFYTGS